VIYCLSLLVIIVVMIKKAACESFYEVCNNIMSMLMKFDTCVMMTGVRKKSSRKPKKKKFGSDWQMDDEEDESQFSPDGSESDSLSE
jgi:hypothetical protein